MIWKTIKGVENYEVSDTGLVKNKATQTLMKPFDSNGYQVVVLSTHGASKRYYVHRLVAINFIDNPDNLPEVDHINRKRNENQVENLRWVSKRDNIRNREWNRAVVAIDKKTGEAVRRFDFIVLAAEWILEERATKRMPVQVAITQCCRGLRKSAYGYYWMYEEEYFDYE